MSSETAQAPWYTNLLLVAGVVLTVVMALLMSQLDRLQTRLVPTVQVVAQPTEPVMTPTPLSAIALATAVPARPTFISSSNDATAPGSTAVPTVGCGQPPAGWVPYIVQAGDTLFALSVNTGAAVDEIVRVNCLEMQPLVTGGQIYLPMTPPPRIVCGPPGWWVGYMVQPGDTLFSLSRSRGTTVSQIMNANCMVSTRLYTGRQIYLPPGGAMATSTALSTSVPTAIPVPPPTKTPWPTDTAVPPTNTATPPPVPTMTPTGTAVIITPTHTATTTSTATSTATATTMPPTYTVTPEPPTSTATAVPPPTDTATPTSTWTPEPLPATPTETPIP